MSYRTLSHLFNDLPCANNTQRIAGFVRDLLPLDVVADCRAVCKPVPNASAWLRIREHAEACGVRAFILVEYRSEGGTWYTTASENVRDALDDCRAMTRRGAWGANIAAITFVAGDSWMRGGKTRIMVCGDGTIDLSNDARTWHIVGYGLVDFIDKLDADLALAVTDDE